jgi:hypothetical protein
MLLSIHYRVDRSFIGHVPELEWLYQDQKSLITAIVFVERSFFFFVRRRCGDKEMDS